MLLYFVAVIKFHNQLSLTRETGPRLGSGLESGQGYLEQKSPAFDTSFMEDNFPHGGSIWFSSDVIDGGSR